VNRFRFLFNLQVLYHDDGAVTENLTLSHVVRLDMWVAMGLENESENEGVKTKKKGDGKGK
jgi:hypothetical protein